MGGRVSEVAINRRSALALAAAGLAAGCAGVAPAVTPPPGATVALPRTAAALDAARAAGQRAQIVVWRDRLLVDEGLGGVDPASLVPWASACKPTTAAAVMRLVDAGEAALDDRVTRFIPAFGQNGKEAVTIRHLMTHTAQLGGYNGPINLPSWEETIGSIVAAPRESSAAGRARVARLRGQGGAAGDAPPPPPLGETPSYNPAGIWILGEILRIVHARPFPEVIRSELYLPLGMDDCWNGMTAAEETGYGDRIARGGFRGGDAAATALAGAAGRAPAGQGLQTNPAGGAYGPVRQFLNFYRMTLDGGAWEGRQVLAAATVEQMIRPQASDGGAWTFGLGFNVNARPVRPLSGPEGRLRYGERPSPEAFGHNGATGLIAFADPGPRLIMVMIGLPASLIDAVYDDLGVA